MTRILVVMLFITIVCGAKADETCSSFVGEPIAPVPIEVAISQLSSLKQLPKGEFETTMDYNSRIEKKTGGNIRRMIIGKPIESRRFFEYDADGERLKIKQYAFTYQEIDLFSAIYGGGLPDKININPFKSFGAVISSSDKKTGYYSASNSFGVRTSVVSIERTVKAIVDPDTNNSYSLFPSADLSPNIVGELMLSPSEARQLKPKLNLAFVVIPKEPFVLNGVHNPGEVTLNNPQSVTERFTILVADIQCGLVLDGSNKVLGAYMTR
ncbi:MAG: hypothetical protein HQL45_17460 [Alphaproteobacteria bacterium]|nr:hypothetical protein [Alphaproteobacteria bacterium]